MAELVVGGIVHFWCGDRDHIADCSRIEAVGEDWVVLRHMSSGTVCMWNDLDRLRKADEWPPHERQHRTVCLAYKGYDRRGKPIL